jgi:hypothetical protein
MGDRVWVGLVVRSFCWGGFGVNWALFRSVIDYEAVGVVNQFF